MYKSHLDQVDSQMSPEVHRRYKKKRGGTIYICIGAACLLAAALLFAYNKIEDSMAGSRADDVLDVLEERIARNREQIKNTGSYAGENGNNIDYGKNESGLKGDGTTGIGMSDEADKSKPEDGFSEGADDRSDGTTYSGQDEQQRYGHESIDDQRPEYEIFPEMEMPTEKINGVRYIGEIYCPKIDRSSPIIYNWSMELLKTAPCRYSGSAYGHDLVIASHNYTRHLGRMLRLRSGDDVYFTDVQGNVFHYKVVDREELAPTDVRDMVTKQNEDDWDLTVFTCTMSGQTRMAIRCELISVSN